MDREQQKWTVVRTFNRHELVVNDFLKEAGLTCFIPMRYREKIMDEGQKPRRILVPVIHNFVFVEKTIPTKELNTLLAKCRTPLYILKTKDTDKAVEIPNREMLEFRMLCDPAFEREINISVGEEDPEVGKEVEIVHGPFVGIRGRLYRKQKKYWFVKTLAGISVELRITRWYCRPVSQES